MLILKEITGASLAIKLFLDAKSVNARLGHLVMPKLESVFVKKVLLVTDVISVLIIVPFQ